MWDEGPPNRGGRPARLGDILPGALEKIGPKGLWDEARVRRAWTAAVGEDVAQHAWVRRLRGTTLEVSVDGDPWATELRYLSSVVIEKLNRILGREAVSELVVQRSRKRSG